MAKKWEEARVAREAKLDGLQERLVGAVDGLVTGEDWQRAMTFAARFRSRSFNNTLLIWSQHLDAFDSGRVSVAEPDRKSTRLNSSHVAISYAVFCLKKKNNKH